MEQIKEDIQKEDNVKCKESYPKLWEIVFNFATKNDFDVKLPLTRNILNDSSHPVTKVLLQIYTMETFVYRVLNHAGRFR